MLQFLSRNDSGDEAPIYLFLSLFPKSINIKQTIPLVRCSFIIWFVILPEIAGHNCLHKVFEFVLLVYFWFLCLLYQFFDCRYLFVLWSPVNEYSLLDLDQSLIEVFLFQMSEFHFL